jgi:hypothetical protein
MVRIGLALLVVLAAVGFGGLTQESNGLSGTVGVEAGFLPGFSADVWLELEWVMDGLSIGSTTEVAVLPGFGVSETLTAGYSFAPVDLLGTLTVDVYPFALAGLELSAAVRLLDITQDRLTVSADTTLLSQILPTFTNTLSLDVDASYGIFSLWSDFDLAIPDFVVSVQLGGEARALDLDLNNGSLTADLGASTFIVPAVDAAMWLDVALTLGSVTVTAETDFTLTPFGLSQQWLEVELGIDGFAIYAWIEFTGGGDLSAAIGGSYDFP